MGAGRANWTAAAALLGVAAAVAPGAAVTPTIVSATDPTGDSGGARDIRGLRAWVDALDRLRVEITLDSNEIRFGDEVRTLVDGDGDGTFVSSSGLDFGVVVTGTTSGAPEIGPSLPGTSPSLQGQLVGTRRIAWQVDLAERGIAPGQRISVAVASSFLAAGTDAMPDAGAPAFVLTALAPGETFGPLRITSFRQVRSGRELSWRLEWQGGDGDLPTTWEVRLSAAGTARTFRGVTRGGFPVTRRVRLPAPWTGSPVRARITLRNGLEVVARTRRVPR